MYAKKTFLAIIPARSGSKRLPGKNILNLAEKPLIYWTIKAGLNSKYIDKVIVTSDNDAILQISKKFGANIIKRPDHLANDIASTFDTIKHTIENINKYDYIVLLQPTSPLRNENHIDKAIDFLELKKANAVVSVCEICNSCALWSNTLPYDDSMVGFLRDGVLNNKTKYLKKRYKLNGAIYICKVDKLLQQKSFFLKKNIFAFKMDKEDSVDIDENIDFKIAEFILA